MEGADRGRRRGLAGWRASLHTVVGMYSGHIVFSDPCSAQQQYEWIPEHKIPCHIPSTRQGTITVFPRGSVGIHPRKQCRRTAVSKMDTNGISAITLAGVEGRRVLELLLDRTAIKGVSLSHGLNHDVFRNRASSTVCRAKTPL
jgi:hypothetical protein